MLYFCYNDSNFRNMKRLLIIVDPQVDFISGVLPVPGAKSAIDGLANHIFESGYKYANIAVTADRHPFNHCSFVQYGGIWARHCVHDSIGAAVDQTLMTSLYAYKGDIAFFHKGESPETEEYSIFKNHKALKCISEIIVDKNIEQIDLCGIAGNICVADTLLDAIELFPDIKFNLLREFSPSMDGGERLNRIIEKFGISCDR